jgi:hypothetical protein
LDGASKEIMADWREQLYDPDFNSPEFEGIKKRGWSEPFYPVYQ